MVINPCCCRATDPAMALPVAAQPERHSGPKRHQPATHSRLYLTIWKSPVLPLFIVPTSSCFFFFHFSATYLLLLVAPRLPECLGSSQEWLRSSLCLLCIIAPDRNHLRHGLPIRYHPLCHVQHHTGAQASSLSEPPPPWPGDHLGLAFLRKY